MNKKVLFPYVGTSVGGSYVSSSLIIEYLNKSTNWEPIVLIPEKGLNSILFERLGLAPEYYNLGKKNVENIKGTNGKLLKIITYIKIYKTALNYLKKYKPDLVHINDDRTINTWGPAAKKLGIPVIWHVRQEQRNKYLDKWRLRLVDYVIFVSNANKVRFPQKINLPQHTTIYNGVDLSKFSVSKKDDFKSSIGLNINKKSIGFIGNLVSRKRPEWFVEAAIKYLTTKKDAEFILVGDDVTNGTYTKKLKRMVSDKGLEEYFKFLGYREDIPSILKALDILVLTSELKGEAFPRVIIEAMASGVPVIATNVAGTSESVVCNETGYLVDPLNIKDLNEKLKYLIGNDELRDKMSVKARDRAMQLFSAEQMTLNIEDVYNIVIDKKK